MQSTTLFRTGALALSVGALSFVVYTAAAPGCAPSEPARPDPTQGGASPPVLPSASPSVEAAGDTNAAISPPSPSPSSPSPSAAPRPVASSAELPRFMGASKAAPVWDEDHMPGKSTGPSNAKPPAQAPQTPNPPGGVK